MVPVWLIMLLNSGLPYIGLKELAGVSQSQAAWADAAVRALAVLAGLSLPGLRRFRPFFLLAAGTFVAHHISLLISGMPAWQRRFPSASFLGKILGVQILRLGYAAIVIWLLWAWKRRPAHFYFRIGELQAPVEPPLLRVFGRRLRWRVFGPAVCLGSSLATWIFLSARGGALPPWGTVANLLPWIALFAALNAFSEEVIYRNALLATLAPVAAPGHCLAISAVLFGIAHFYGVPYGTLGVAMATLFGYFLAKSVLETKGMFWAWFIHFVQDCLIYPFMAAGLVTSGGR